MPTPKIADGYRLVEGPPSVTEYRNLRAESGLSPRTEAQAQAGIGGALFAYHVVHEATGTAVGMARVIGDGGWYFHVIDMAVLPEHQRKGLGVILQALLERIQTTAPPGAIVNLIADPPGVPLYKKNGFKETPPAIALELDLQPLGNQHAIRPRLHRHARTLHFHVRQPRKAKEPVTIFFTGGGVPTAAHVRLQRVLAADARVYFYDRSGYDQSEPSPSAHPTAEEAASDLALLMQAIDVPPPYILVAHSYGGFIARKFLALQDRSAPGSIVGMVLVDTVTELTHQVFPAIPSTDLIAVAEGVDFNEVTHLRRESRLTDKEWETAMEAVERTQPGATAEDNRLSGRLSALKRQIERGALHDHPLSVIRCHSIQDYRALYEAGIKAGNGSEEQRVRAREFIEKWDLFGDELMAGQLRLSSKNRYRYVPDTGHSLPLTNRM